MNFISFLLLITGGYLLGSISPAYILGRILKKIDIRKHGTKNAGTVNTYRILGLVPAVFTAIFDLSKGLLVMYIAYLTGASPWMMHIAGFAVILGHVFPFYLRFKGGQGMATAVAILLYYLVLFYIKGWIPWQSLLFLLFYILSFIHIVKKKEIIGTTILPILAAFSFVFVPSFSYSILAATIIAYVLSINIMIIVRNKLLVRRSEKMEKEVN